MTSSDEEQLAPKKKKGCLVIFVALMLFTLLLASVFVPNFLRARSRGIFTNCKENLKRIAAALDHYATDHAGRYPDKLEQLVPEYLENLPTCAASGGRAYYADFGPNAKFNSEGYEDYFYLSCVGGLHEKSGIVGDFPAFDSVIGLQDRKY